MHGERPAREQTKARKDLLQAGSLVSYFLASGQESSFNAAWRETLDRGPGWRRRAEKGRAALMKLAPELDVAALWRSRSIRKS